MNRGPQRGRSYNGDDRSFAEKAAAAWDGQMPDWVDALAGYADRHGLKGAAAKISYSVSLVSTVIGNKYRGDLVRVEAVCRGAFLGDQVQCPVLGLIGSDRCLVEQAEPFRATSAYRAQLYHACRGGCPHSRIKGGADER